MRIRHADPAGDAAACAAIYAPYVRDTGVSFEEEAPDPDAFAARIARLAATHAYLVADGGEGAVGFAHAGPHRERHAYRWATEVSVYVDERHRRAGIGRALYGALLPLLTRQGYWTALAGITLPNPASVALHERLGFRLVGVYEQIGWKAGEWRDVGWWQRPLQPEAPTPTDTPPPEPGPPARLPE